MSVIVGGDFINQSIPLTALLGRVYTARLTGTLKVTGGDGKTRYIFWFKQGFPCHSWSHDRIALLGEQFGPGKREMVESYLARFGETEKGGRLLGQRLLGESLVSLDELRAALLSQLSKRLLCCAVGSDYVMEFRSGWDEFRLVPVSTVLLNPMEVAARAAGMAPFERMREWLMRESTGCKVRLAKNRRVPPSVRPLLSDSLLRALSEPQEVSRIMEVPSHVRTLGFLHALGFVEYEHSHPEAASCSQLAKEKDPAGTDRGIKIINLAKSGACYYDLLGIPWTATTDQIKRAYRSAALAIHPDRGFGDVADRQEAFSQLVEAYHTLSRNRLRAEYDSRLVASGAWSSWRDAESVQEWLRERRDQLAKAGYQDLAGEYQHMLAIVAWRLNRESSWEKGSTA